MADFLASGKQEVIFRFKFENPLLAPPVQMYFHTAGHQHFEC